MSALGHKIHVLPTVGTLIEINEMVVILNPEGFFAPFYVIRKEIVLWSVDSLVNIIKSFFIVIYGTHILGELF